MSKLVAIATADWHLHNWKASYEYKGDRLADCMQAMKLIQGRATDERVPILLAGDLFHKPKAIPNEVLDKFSMFFNHQTLTLAISGNHDQSQKNTIKHDSPSWVVTMHHMMTSRIRCIDRLIWGNKDFDIAGIPYLTHNLGFSKIKRQLENKLKNSTKPKILMIHRDLPGAKTPMGYEVNEVDDINDNLDIYFNKWDLVLCGHIHKPQKLAKKVYMLGAPYHQDAGDRGTDMGYWEVYSDMSIKFVKLLLPEYKLVPKDGIIPDTFNIWVPRQEVIKVTTGEGITKFSNKMSRVKIAKNYLKEKGVKSKAKKAALIKSLQND